MLEESTNDSLDDLTLSSLRKRIKTEECSTDQTAGERNTSPPPLTSITVQIPASNSKEIPPMPPLTKAPSPRNNPPPTSTSTMSSATETPAPALTPQPPINRSSHKRLRSNEDQTPLFIT